MSTPVQTLIGKFVWHENYSNDVDAAKKFYADLFGWDFETWEPGEVDYSMVKVGEQMHAGFLAVQGGARSALARDRPGRELRRDREAGRVGRADRSTRARSTSLR